MSAARVTTRVLQVIPDLGGGGAERLVLNLANGLDRLGYEVRVLSLYGPAGSPVEKALADSKVPVAHLGKHPGFDPAMFGRIWAAISACRPRILHTHRYVLQYLLPTILIRRSCRVVHTVHNLAALELPRAGRVAHRVAMRSGVAFVSIGASVTESFREMYGRPPRAMIGNGIPVNEYASPRVGRAEWRRREGVAPDRPVFVSVARLQQQKNVACLLRAFRLVLRDNERTPLLLVVGSGPQRDDLVALAEELGIAGHVRFLGSRTDVADILGAADAFVLSSDWEGNPLSLMEAMAAGLPVASTRVGGVSEIVEDGITGILTEPHDEGSLATAMATLMRDGEVRTRMGSAGRKRAQDRFDVATMCREYAALYDELGRER